jgi:hypothetical protein
VFEKKRVPDRPRPSVEPINCCAEDVPARKEQEGGHPGKDLGSV